LHDGREHVGGRGVIDEPGARTVGHRQPQKGARPIAIARAKGALARVHMVAGVHAQQVVHLHRRQVAGHVGRGLLRKELEHGIVHRQQPLVHGQAHGGGGKGLAQRKEHVRALGAIGRPPGLGRHLAVAQQHERVQPADLFLHGVDKGLHCSGRDAHRFRRGADEFLGHGAPPGRKD